MTSFIRRHSLIASFVAGALVFGGAALAAAFTPFSAGETLQAAKLNANFAALETRIATATPAGSILATASANCPEGTLAMNGTTVAKSQYPRLYTAIGDAYGVGSGDFFKLPNAEGVFLRGLGSQTFEGRVYAAAARGSIQGDAFQNFTGSFAYVDASGGMAGLDPDGTLFRREGAFQNRPGRAGGSGSVQAGVRFDPSAAARTSAETRPVNISVKYCIWY